MTQQEAVAEAWKELREWTPKDGKEFALSMIKLLTLAATGAGDGQRS